MVATVGMYSLALAFARLTLVEQLFKRGAVVDVGRGYVDGADELVFLVGIDVRLVALEIPVVFFRPACVGVFVFGLFVAPLLR